MTGKHLGTALAVATGIVLANGQPAGAQNTADEPTAASQQAHNEAQRAHQDATDAANRQQRQASGQHQSGDQQWNDQQQRNNQQQDRQQQNDRQWNDDQQRNRGREEDRNRDRQGDRQWSDQQRDRHSDIRFDRSNREGLVIASIGAGTPFYRSGLRQGDVIVSLDGRELRNEDDFYRWSQNRGERVPVIVLRDGQRETVYIQYDRNRDTSRSNLENTGSYESQAYLGVRFEMRFRNGAVISGVVPGSPAEEAGLKTGDEIVAINGRQVDAPRDVTRVVESLSPGERIDIEFARRMEQQTQAVLEEHPRSMASAQYQRGESYDRGIEQSSYDEEGNYGAPDEYNQSDRGIRSERRGGGLLRGLRN